MMQPVCAWCRTPLGPEDADRRVTHTICADCYSNIEFQAGVNLQRFIDSLRVPVVVVDNDVVVRMANATACDVIGKALPTIEGQHGGNVFECAYARLPEGCGQTMHCSGCAIRRAVATTWASGESLVRVPAQLTQYPKTDRRIDLWITTEKCGAYVLLKIEEAGDPTILPNDR